MYRRQLLGAGLALCTSGCVTGVFGGTNESLTIGQIEIDNVDESPHEVQIQLDADSDLVYSKTVQLDKMHHHTAGFITLDREWPRDVQQYTVRARYDDHDWESVVYDKPQPYTCWNLQILLDRDGSLDILSGSKPHPKSCAKASTRTT